jgi:hypothetical protein
MLMIFQECLMGSKTGSCSRSKIKLPKTQIRTFQKTPFQVMMTTMSKRQNQSLPSEHGRLEVFMPKQGSR